jgi:glutamate synthase (NADPH/NADH) small chain
MFRIVHRETLAESTFSWVVAAPDIARAAQAGQFVMVRLHEGGERIPLTLADFDAAAGTVTLVIQAVGRTTRDMEAHFAAGDTFSDLAGPLGRPQHIDRAGMVLLVGGGLGVAPVYAQARAFREAGNRVRVVLGFRDARRVFWTDRFAALVERPEDLVICTEDGSAGRTGRVTDPLAEACAASGAGERPDLVVTVGPLAMMRACAEVTRSAGVPTLASINTLMVDGTGMCGACRVTVGGQVRFACVDGPDFDAHAVDFAELLARQGRFAREEARASEDYAHLCRVEHQLFELGAHEYKKLRTLAPHQAPMPERDATERVRHFEEVGLGYSLADALAEAERCIQCTRAPCVGGCPVGVDIPGFIRHVLVRDFDGALEVIHRTNAFPSICGRVCPQEAQCEAQCIVGKKLEPVGIGRLERFVGDRAARHATAPSAARATARPSRVAVVGSGPAGLAAATDLARAGVEVTVFEALHVVGGVLRYGIPAFRLPRSVIDREVEALSAQGVRFETNKVIGTTFTLDDLLSSEGYDAAFVGAGAGAPVFLGLPGEFAGQVYSANEFLTRVNLMAANDFPVAETPLRVGQSVVVLGGGNTAMDCVRVARRLGVPTVRCVYRRSEAEAPARAEELRHAREEGVEFLFLHAPLDILVDDRGEITGLRVEEMAQGEPDTSGRRKPVHTGREQVLACDTVIYALGTQANPLVSRTAPGLQTNPRGHIVVDPETQATSLRGVFAGGDIVTGGATVVLAMGAGRRAAAAILRSLESDRAWPPSVGATPAVSSEDAAPTGPPCPKCRRPVAGPEAYICCADAMLSWQCRDCARVDEGFAFPYGLCPACGGTLEPRDPAAIRSTAALEAVRTAFEIELGGLSFYRRAADETTSPVMRALFGRLAAMEAGHMSTLAARYHLDPPASPPVVFLDRAAIFSGVPRDPRDPVNLFRIAIAFEQRALRFFSAAAAEAGERTGPAGEDAAATAALYRELAAEEAEHVAMLETELARYLADRPGLL